jgi:acetylornithine deacetylase/succinyl-diaminopimelate desuccinylase-like protein
MAQTPQVYLEARAGQALDELIEFAAIPSVSTDPAYAGGMAQAAQWVADRLARAGVEQVQVLPTARHPVVYGAWLHATDRPTVLVYGHYDVQPPDPLERWASAPFAPEVRDGKLYGRGVSDDKGPMLIPILVVEALLATAGRLPVNVKFLFEGEEEIGSPSLEPFITDHADLLAADVVLSADGAMWRVDVPSITVASRGLAGLEFTVQGPAKDLHSGRHGGAVANPLHALARLVASLHTDDGRVAVAGFYDDVAALDAAERAGLDALPFSDDDYLQQVGAPALVGEPGYGTLARLWARPTLEVNGLWGGYQGAGSKTVIPAEAHAKITCRLVPDQRPDDIVAKVAAHLRSHTPLGVTLAIRDGDHGAAAYAIPADHPALQAAAAVLAEVYGAAPYRVRMGGTLPVSELFRRILGIYTVFFSFSTADEDFHAPNEFFRVARLYEGQDAWARLLARLGDMTG